ncbi:transposase [Facklamia miroungae]|uniref:transposase n=1 Tax=Facklamia miroungae TaxID=120956 RepID=UPI00117B75C3|nr:transposase [Facklamia miroungae]NKZ30304.1 hypothetical protein [Facklamia miroungae]
MDVKSYNTCNSKNGFYSKTLIKEYGTLNLKIPHDRSGELDVKILQCLQQALSSR